MLFSIILGKYVLLFAMSMSLSTAIRSRVNPRCVGGFDRQLPSSPNADCTIACAYGRDVELLCVFLILHPSKLLCVDILLFPVLVVLLNSSFNSLFSVFFLNDI